MKKLLLFLMVAAMPFLVKAQPMNYVTIFSENFDGATQQMTTQNSPS